MGFTRYIHFKCGTFLGTPGSTEKRFSQKRLFLVFFSLWGAKPLILSQIRGNFSERALKELSSNALFRGAVALHGSRVMCRFVEKKCWNRQNFTFGDLSYDLTSKMTFNSLKNVHTHAHAPRTRTYTHAGTHARTHVHTHAHTRTHAHAHYNVIPLIAFRI